MKRSFTDARKKRADTGSSRRLLPVRVIGPGALALYLVLSALAPAQVIHRNSFETRTLAWSKGAADAQFKETAHDISDQTAHSGQYSEHIQLTAEIGNYIYYNYGIGRAALAEELSISVWVKANRPGAQLMARLVLPHERKAENINEPLSVLLRGDQYQLVGRWERLELRQPLKLAKEQQQLLRLELKREVDVGDAYIDLIVLNVYGGPGLTEVWLDDLEAGPVFEDQSPGPAPTDNPTDGKLTSSGRSPASARNAVVELNQEHLQVNGKRFFPRAIQHTDTPLKVLRDIGCNCVCLDASATPAEIEEAINLGLWLVPALPLNTGATPSSSAGALGSAVSRFLQGDAVLFWYLGGGRTLEEADLVGNAALALRSLDPGRPVGADVWDGFMPYARYLDLVGAHRWPLMTSLELPQYREWLNQRRLLAQPRSTFQWTWVQTHLPDWFTTLVYDRKSDATGKPMTSTDFDEPIGPQPEQIRLLTYTALAAGCQGIAYWSDRFLADSHQGRDRLLALALLNQELQMLEPLLLSVVETPTWIDTSIPEVKAAVLRAEKGVLVLPMWLGKGAQYVPGQSAAAKLTLTVPQAPAGTQAWEITPGDVRALPIERVIGGTKVTIQEFGLTTAIVFTADNSPTGLLVRFQDHARRTRKLAAQWAHDLAEEEIKKVLQVEAELERAAHTLPDGKALQEDAQNRLAQSVEYWNNGDFRQAYQESQRALRPLRILMRAQWEQATRGFDSPVASPYAVSFYTLPRHWEFADQVRHAAPQANVLPDGGFEADPRKEPSGWLPQEVTTDLVELIALRVGVEFQEAKPQPAAPSPKSNLPAPGSPNLANPAGPKPAGTEKKEPPQLAGTDKKEGAQPAGTDKKGPAKPVRLEPEEGQRCLKLQIKPKDPLQTPAALERTFLAVNSPAVHLEPGSLVRVSAWVRVVQPIAASVDGALFYDSAGGEPLAIRVTDVTGGWKKYTLYRRVPATGTISVTLALTGIGTVYFDDVRIEPLTPDRAPAQPTQWRKQETANRP